MSTKKVVLFCDGSCRPNPGYAGFGILGYVFKDSEKPKNHKHPHHATLYFTPTGIQKEKSESPIEVIDIIEVIQGLSNNQSTNNEAELNAIVTGLQLVKNIEDIGEVTIFTDSNYIVTAFNENLEKWKANNWKRIDGKPIIHLPEWSIIDDINELFKQQDIKLNINWIKGHSDNYGNNIADIYSVIGSNAAKQLMSGKNEVILNQVISYADYKKSYNSKDFIFYFRDMYFSSDKLDDVNYCFISTSDDPALLGKRNNSSIFVSNVGYVPSVISKIKEFYRSIQRNYITTCCIKINKLENKDIYRLTEFINSDFLLIKSASSQNKAYYLVGDNTPFLYENTVSFPFIVNASAMFNRMTYIDSVIDEQMPNIYKYDVTDIFMDKENNKLKLTNKDKNIDLSEMIKNDIELKQSLIIKLGYDIPNFLALKNIEEEIEKIFMVIEANTDNNFCTVYMNIITKSRSIYSVNIENKYLRKYK